MGEYIGNNNANTITPTRVSGGVSRNPAGSFPSDAVDTLRGRGGNDILDGGGGADNVSGGAGNDRITLGLDVTFTGSRDVVLDTGVTRTISLTDASGTADTVDGGGGIDGLVLNRGTGTGFILDAFNFPPTLSGVERIIGTDGVDLIALPLAYGSAEGGAVEIAGRGGDDVLIGSDSTMDDILGGDGDDLLAGLNGEDELSGGAGIDILLGGDGNDILDGGPGGNAGPNGDVLDGGAGNDTIIGGAQFDTMTGGAGADTFLWRDITDALTRFEPVMDFVQGEDIFDVSQIDAIEGTPANDAFVFVGTAAFTAAGQISYNKFLPGGLTTVAMNVDADTRPEGVFQLARQLVDLNAANFIL